MIKKDHALWHLNQIGFAPGCGIPHGRVMDESNAAPNTLLVAAVFCAIIVLIAYAGFIH